MKTVDLIPLILLELNECDKYGFELTKNIENKSNGKILIKQPTLYTLLKKLEKSKFITSYWQDSEIGGKRHYYKLTENGKIHVSTLPSYGDLLKNILNQDEDSDESDLFGEKADLTSTQPLNEPTPIETILPTEEVFSENNIDSSTEVDINLSNVEILKENSLSNDEQFATNENVSKFTKNNTSPIPEQKNEFVSNSVKDSIIDVNFTVTKSNDEIEYIDYIDIKNNENYKYSKNIAKKLFLQSLATSGSLIFILALCAITTLFVPTSNLYYFYIISSILVALFYPVMVFSNIDKIRLKYQTKKYEPKTKQKLLFGLVIMLLTIILCIVVSINKSNSSIGLIFGINNFANLYAPILITSVLFLDILFNHLFLTKKSIK